MGQQFHFGAWKAIRSGRANMDVLVHLGTTTAFLWSTLVMFEPMLSFLPDIFGTTEHVYFDGAALIIAFVLLGNYLEGRAKLQATDAIFSLMDLQPKPPTFSMTMRARQQRLLKRLNPVRRFW